MDIWVFGFENEQQKPRRAEEKPEWSECLVQREACLNFHWMYRIGLVFWCITFALLLLCFCYDSNGFQSIHSEISEFHVKYSHHSNWQITAINYVCLCLKLSNWKAFDFNFSSAKIRNILQAMSRTEFITPTKPMNHMTMSVHDSFA